METKEKLRMDAYYYGFDPTNNHHVDMILSAVASAGKAFHHTEAWNNDCVWVPFKGDCPVLWIQNAANEAKEYFDAKAEKIKNLEDEVKLLRYHLCKELPNKHYQDIFDAISRALNAKES